MERGIRTSAAALAVMLPVQVLVAEAAHRLAAAQPEGCGIQAFGVQYPMGGDCYASIDDTVALLAGVLLLGLAVLARRGRWLSLTAIPCGLMALRFVPPVMQQTVPLTPETLQLALFAAVPFLVVRPAGPARSEIARVTWILAMLALGALAILDMLFSGFFSPAQQGPQVGLVVVLVAVALAGWVSGRLVAARTIAPETAPSV
jgi:hypothetical protein